MAKMPKDLTNASWKSVKGLTVPETGFGKVLDAYQAARKKSTDLPTRSVASFDAAAKALQNITKAVPVAVGKCNKTLHKDTIAALGGYKSLVDAEGGELHKEAVQYQGYIDMFKHKREVCGKEMAILKKSLDMLAKDAVLEIAGLVKTKKSEDLEKAKSKVKAYKTQLKKIQDDADASLAKPRVPGPAKETPHVDDRPDASVFTALIEIQKNIIAERTNTERALDKLVGA